MQNKVYALLIILAILAGSLFLSPAISVLMKSVTIGNSGQISISTTPSNRTAASGRWQDIQAAVNQVANAGGGNVYIPEGTFNFVEVGESWTGARVVIPAGVNVYGAPTERDVNNQVVEWRTILRIPWGDFGTWASVPVMFRIVGNGDPNKPSQFSDIKIVGFRSIDSSAADRVANIQQILRIDNTRDFRVDHCAFENFAYGITTWGFQCNGVIDHNRIYNTNGISVLTGYTNGNIMYGIQVGRDYYSTGYGYEPLMSVLGKYTDHSIYIEDNYFSKFRHNVASNHGAHYVFRYNTIDQDFGDFSLDMHGLRDEGDNRWGTRAAEFYENTLTNAEVFRILQTGGSSGVWFNNYIDDSYRAITLYAEDYIPSDTWHLKDFYMWSAKGATPTLYYSNGEIDPSRNVVADWARQTGNPADPNYPNVNPSWSIAGYRPYPYPHPLALT